MCLGQGYIEAREQNTACCGNFTAEEILRPGPGSVSHLGCLGQHLWPLGVCLPEFKAQQNLAQNHLMEASSRKSISQRSLCFCGFCGPSGSCFWVSQTPRGLRPIRWTGKQDRLGELRGSMEGLEIHCEFLDPRSAWVGNSGGERRLGEVFPFV